MKQIKTAAIVLFITIITASSAMAQQHKPTGPPALTDLQVEKMVTDLSSTLELSEKQEINIRSIYKNHFKQIKSSKTKTPQYMEELKSEMEKDVKSLLTKEQKKKYKKYLRKQEQKEQSSRPQRGPRGRPQGAPGR